MATTLNVIITDAGIAEVINAEHTGTAPVVLTQVGLGRGVYTPTPDQTALHDEIKRLSAISGGVVGDNIMHIQALDGTAGASYAVYEIGVYTASGTLFAVYSQALPIIHKVADSEIMLAIDFVLAGFEPTSVTVGDTNYSLAPATTSNQGVVELATDEEAVAGTDTERALTPKSGAAAMDDKISTHSDLIASDDVPGHFSFLAGGTEPFTTKTSDGKKYHTLNSTYMSNNYVTIGTWQFITGNKTARGVWNFTSSLRIDGSSTGELTINGEGMTPKTDSNFFIGALDKPIGVVRSREVYADAIYPIDSEVELGNVFMDGCTLTGEIDVSAALTIKTDVKSYENSIKLGTPDYPFGSVNAKFLNGAIPSPTRDSQSGTITYPYGSILCVVNQWGDANGTLPGQTVAVMSASSAPYVCSLDGTQATVKAPVGYYKTLTYAAANTPILVLYLEAIL